MEDGLETATEDRGCTAGLRRTVDPFFSLENSHAVVLGPHLAVSKLRVLATLLAGIRRQPKRLHRHVQRINLLLAEPDEVALKAALVDLFIAVGYRGIDLKTRMLDEARPHLGPATLVFFEQNIFKGLAPDDPGVGDVRGSVLSHGLTGRSQLISVPPHASATDYGTQQS